MRYPLDTYRKYGVFCQTVAVEAKRRLGTSRAAASLGGVLAVIAALVINPMVLGAVVTLLGLGAVAFYGGIGTLMATNPVLAGILGGAMILGPGIGGIMAIYKHRRVVKAFKESVSDRYEGDFTVVTKQIAPPVDVVPSECAVQIESLVDRAVADFYDSLVPLGRLSPDDIDAANQARWSN